MFFLTNCNCNSNQEKCTQAEEDPDSMLQCSGLLLEVGNLLILCFNGLDQQHFRVPLSAAFRSRAGLALVFVFNLHFKNVITILYSGQTFVQKNWLFDCGLFIKYFTEIIVIFLRIFYYILIFTYIFFSAVYFF